ITEHVHVSAVSALALVPSSTAVLLVLLSPICVGALDFWSVPHPSLPHSEFPAAVDLRRRVVGLPVHQELRRKDVERIAQAVRGPSRPRSELRVERLSSLESVRKEGTRLAEETGNIFAPWEGNALWWRHQGDGHSLLAYQCRDKIGRAHV